MLLFADDITLMQDNIIYIYKSINILSIFRNKLRLQINKSKTKLLIMTQSKHDEVKIKLHNDII